MGEEGADEDFQGLHAVCRLDTSKFAARVSSPNGFLHEITDKDKEGVVISRSTLTLASTRHAMQRWPRTGQDAIQPPYRRQQSKT